MNLYRKIDEWLKNYEPLNNWIYFNATPDIVGTVALNSIPGDGVVARFIDGSKKCEILFAIDMVREYDNMGTSEVNMEALDEVNNFIEWLDSQRQDENFPDFGTTNTVRDIQVLTNVPTVLVNTQDMLSKFQIQVKVTYIDNKEVKF